VQRVTGTGGLLTFEEPRTDHVTVRFYRIVPAQESLWKACAARGKRTTTNDEARCSRAGLSIFLFGCLAPARH
jgi:hypothetical protein